ncbi:MAG: hypothetical protein II680_01580, partial [Clostridia bacterium]|nr:hypothetical protein [Clostridia bacterium]
TRLFLFPMNTGTEIILPETIIQYVNILPYRGTSCQEEKDRSGVTPSASSADFPVTGIQPDHVPASLFPG